MLASVQRLSLPGRTAVAILSLALVAQLITWYAKGVAPGWSTVVTSANFVCVLFVMAGLRVRGQVISSSTRIIEYVMLFAALLGVVGQLIGLYEIWVG